MKKHFLRLRSRPSAEGFTLLEMLAVIIMLGILFAIMGPSWLAFTSRQRANNSREQVLQAIRLGQSEASRTRTPHKLIFNTSVNPPTLCIIQAVPANATCPPSRQERLGFGSYRAGAVSLTTPTNEIYFDQNGNIDLTRTTVQPPMTVMVRSPANTGTRRCVVIQTPLVALSQPSDGEPGCP